MPEKQREPKVVPPTDPRVKGHSTRIAPAAPAQPVPPHCPSCGYTEEDAQINGDHRLCNNAGNAPWEITPIITPIHAPLAAPSPVLTPASNAITKCAETSKCVHGVRLKEHCAECPQSPPLLETPVLTQPSAELGNLVIQGKLWPLKQIIQVCHNILLTELGRKCSITEDKCWICKEVEAFLNNPEAERPVLPVPPLTRFSIYPWLNETIKASGWNVGRFIQFCEEHEHMDALADTIIAWQARASSPAVAPTKGDICLRSLNDINYGAHVSAAAIAAAYPEEACDICGKVGCDCPLEPVNPKLNRGPETFTRLKAAPAVPQHKQEREASLAKISETAERVRSQPEIYGNNRIAPAVAGRTQGDDEVTLEREWMAQKEWLDYRNWLVHEVLRLRAALRESASLHNPSESETKAAKLKLYDLWCQAGSEDFTQWLAEKAIELFAGRGHQ